METIKLDLSYKKSLCFLRRGDDLYTVVRVAERSAATCALAGRIYYEESNSKEPFDFKTLIFTLPAAPLLAGEKLTLSIKPRRMPSEYFTSPEQTGELTLSYADGRELTQEQADEAGRRYLIKESSAGFEAAPGLDVVTSLWHTGEGAPVRVFAMYLDPSRVTVVTGTPGGTTEFIGRKATVMEEAQTVAEAGYEVLGATNADFFDMFGDCAPSGPVVRGGVVITDSGFDRPVFGIRKNGEPAIADVAADHTLLYGFRDAVAGKNILLRDGVRGDFAPLEPFGYIAHPRTAAGVCADGRALILVVDGRIPEYSNGASLPDLCDLMCEHGATDALNLDGGGSSTFIVKKDGELQMLNRPADLHRPTERLIRPLYDSMIIVRV